MSPEPLPRAPNPDAQGRDHPPVPESPSPPPGPPSRDQDLVPSYDVRNCLVCGLPMEGRKCKYLCRSCGTMIDCSDAY